jgi:hypothetical protein
MIPHTKHLIILATLNIPVYVGLGRMFFGSWNDFWECVRTGFNGRPTQGFMGFDIPPNIWSHIKVMSFTIIIAVLLNFEENFFFHGA